MLRALVFACLSLVATSQVFAMSLNSSIKTDGHIEIQLEGKLLKGDETVFAQYIGVMRAKAVVDGISLSSTGGLVDVALSIGRIVHESGIYTYVPPGKSCNSACVLIFVSSANKFIGANGALGVHQASTCLDKNPLPNLPCVHDEINAKGTQLMTDYYKRNGVSDSVILKMQTTRPYWLTTLTPDDLKLMDVKLIGVAPGIAPASYQTAKPLPGWGR